MFIKSKINIVFSILIIGAVYWVYGSLAAVFSSEDEISQNANFSTIGSIRRKLLALNSSENEYSLELEPHLNTLNREKLDSDEKTNVFKKFSYVKLHRNRTKLSRRKRDIPHNDFGWKLHLNVTNNKNPPKGASDLASVNDLISTHGKRKFLNMAVQMEGASPDNSFKDLHHSWDSLGFLLRRLYGKTASFKDNARDNSAEISTVRNDIVQSDISPEKPERGRTPKLIFGFFNPKSSENPLEDAITHTNDDSSESVTSTTRNEGLISTIIPLSSNTTEVPIEVFGLTESTLTESTVVPITETFMDFESTSSELSAEFEKTSDNSVNNFPIPITTIKPENTFTSEQLKEFCISLLSRIHISPKSGDNFSEDDGSGEPIIIGMGDRESMSESPQISTETPEEVTTKSANQIVGIWTSIWNRFVGRRMVNQPPEFNQQLPTLTVEPEFSLEKAINSGDVLSLKGESSTSLDIASSTESDFFSDEDESALTVPDCEHFFRYMQNDAVFSKPNLFDIINNPILLNLHPSELNFTEIRDDKQMRSITFNSTGSNIESNLPITEETVNNLNTPFSSAVSTVKELSDEISVIDLFSEQPDKNAFNVTFSSQDVFTPSSFVDDQDSFQNEENEKPNINNLITEKEKNKATEIILSDQFTTVQIKSVAEILDDRLTILSDIHTRTEKASEMPSAEVSTDIDSRIFGILNFGSGERSLEDLDSLTTENVSEFPENRSFPPDLVTFASGDSQLNEAFSNILQITSTDSATRRGLSLRKENQTNITESDAFVINEKNQFTEDGSTIISVENPRTEFQFDPEEKFTENQNILDLTNKPLTQSVLGDQMPFQNGFDETTAIEIQLKPEEFTESPNVIRDSTHLRITQSLSEAPTAFQNVLEDGSGDKESRIFPGLLNVFGSGDGREMSELSTELEVNSEFSECLDCFKNKSSSLSDGGCIDCEANASDIVPFIGENISTTVNSLLHEIALAVTLEETYPDTQEDAFSESNHNPLESSTNPLDRLTSSNITGLVSHEHHDTYENVNKGDENYYYNTENNEYEYHDGYENTISEIHDKIETYDHEVTSFLPLEHIHVEGECNESHSDVNMEVFSENPMEDTTTSKDPRFIDTLFLTGSGAGGLFDNDNGEINFVPEPDTTSFPFPVSSRQSRRGGRMGDVPFDHTWPTEEKEHISKNQFDIQSQNESEDPTPNSLDKDQGNKVLIPKEVEKFNIDTNTFRSTHGIEDGFKDPQFTEFTTQSFQDVSKEIVTPISIPTSSFVIPKKKVKDLAPKYCNHAGECNIALNEGCITKKGYGVCDCRRSFVRDPETDICEAPFILKTSLKLPEEAFHQDLRDKYSELYQNKTRDAIDTMWLVVYQDPTLEESVADIHVVGFEEGSLVIHWELIFAVKNNESISKIVQEVDDKLKETFKHQVVLHSAPLNVENAKLLSVSSDINPCEIKKLNYCSKHADCIKDEYRGFKCRCKVGYLDNSKHPMYPGEICIATCPVDFCGENGYCEVRLNGEKQCLCNGWYFGEKCNVSGMFIISCFAGANCVLIVVVMAIVCCCKRRRQRRARFYENNQIMFQPNQPIRQFGQVSPRLTASIALDEMGPTKPSKYMAISTPLNMVPDIQITSPSILGSSISYDYDSTFDRTPSAKINMEPPKYDSVPEVPKYDSIPEV